MTGLALALSELPTGLARAHRLAERVYDREGRTEYQFHWWAVPTVLPVRRAGRLEVVAWGSKIRRGPLPYGGWVSEEHVRGGLFAHAAPEEVVIPANLGFHRGVWFLITQGVRGVLVETRAGPVAYMLTTPASNYYRNMTEQSPVMPVLVGQVI